ncbi:winged helix-turn-helix domain-containing protein/riboflavin kinase [Thermoplasma sp.]|uniref:winged helix-turn-helix domain-containing protein/riboflavin kinase n=1 Tax=Thermoplasma sp. TaxID=1973142 RepID=UPI0012884F3E|nr:winged helix-turn-helix domain-containing protein/riboflavin kinase [Thermoplasma sp.]KAA8922986.1 MAG: CTP-dependent riboflavin kinase [Thermoplasma sp.]
METSDQYYRAIKRIKEVAEASNRAYLTSSKLADMLGISQQSASRIIIDLEKNGYITRTVTKRGQILNITEKGLDVLYTEFADLSRILSIKNNIVIAGTITSGMGEGRYYVARKQYIIQFQEKLGIIPYLGTLNIKVDQASLPELRKIRGFRGIHIDGFKTEDRTFGAVKAFSAKVQSVPCFVIMPERTVYTDVIEVISDKYLREELNLHDGDRVTVEVYT